MDTEECYAWGELFTRDRDALAAGMSERAGAMGLTQHELDETLIWKRDAKSPCCFVVVKQPDASDTREDIIFDIFRLNPLSFLWHFNRVYTRPETVGTER